MRTPLLPLLLAATVLGGCTTKHAVAVADIPALARGEAVRSLDGSIVRLGGKSVAVKPLERMKFVDLNADGDVELVDAAFVPPSAARVPGRANGPVQLTPFGQTLVVQNASSSRSYAAADIDHLEVIEPRSKGATAGIIIGSTLGGLAAVGAIVGAAVLLTSGSDMGMGFSSGMDF